MLSATAMLCWAGFDELREGLQRSHGNMLAIPDSYIASGFGEETPEELATIEQTLAEMLICKAVDIFNLYLSDLLRGLLRTQRIGLWVDDTVKVAKLLEYDSIADFLEHQAPAKADALTRQGFARVLRFLTDRGINPTLDADTYTKVETIIMIRNRIVHAGGHVDHLLNSRMQSVDLVHPSRRVEMGRPMPIDIEDSTMWKIDLDMAVEAIDDAARLKFGTL